MWIPAFIGKPAAVVNVSNLHAEKSEKRQVPGAHWSPRLARSRVYRLVKNLVSKTKVKRQRRRP